MNQKKHDLSRPAIVLGMIIFVIGLGLFAYLGFFNRYYADDWCYNADLKELGLIGALKGYSYITTYASNRFSLTLFAGLFYALGIFGVQIMSLLFILLWVLSLAWILHNITRMADLPFSKQVIFFLAAGVTYYSIYLAPHLYQSMYWRSGLLPYTAALTFSLGLFGLITYQATRQRPSVLLLIVSGLLAFLAGGFSESGTATLVSALGLNVLAAWLYRKQEWARRSLPSGVVGLLFAVLAMGVLVVSPTSDHRLALYGEPAGLLELPGLVIRFTSDFILFSFKDAPLPHLAILATFALLGILVYAPLKRPLNARIWLGLLVLISGIAFILIAASYAPSAYIEQAPPATRSRILPRFELTLFLALIAFLSGYFLRQYIKVVWLEPIALLLLILGFVYTARTLWITSDKISLYSQRAVVWDERDRIIQQARQAGLQEVHVRGIDGLPVGGIRDLKDEPGPGYWINICTERYYGVEAIYADLP